MPIELLYTDIQLVFHGLNALTLAALFIDVRGGEGGLWGAMASLDLPSVRHLGVLFEDTLYFVLKKFI